MPPALPREKALAVKAKLLLNIPHESIAESLKISTRQLQAGLFLRDFKTLSISPKGLDF